MATHDRIGPRIGRETPIVPTNELLIRIDRLERRLTQTGGGWNPGDIKCSASPNVPDGWLPCDGRTLSRADYPGLFAAIGVRYGAGDGTFNLPDVRQRIPRYDPNAIGWTGGADTHTLIDQEMPAHVHDLSPGSTGWVSSDHQHWMGSVDRWNQGTVRLWDGGGAFTSPGASPSATDGITANHYHSLAGNTNWAGSGWAHNNLPRAMNLNFIIKT